MGGLIAAEMAAEFPHRIDRLVLVDAAFLGFDPGLSNRAIGLARWLRVSTSELIRLVARDTMRADPVSLTRATLELLRCDWRSCLPRIEAPTLVIWGERDTVTPLRIGERLSAELQISRLVVIPAAGHVPMWDRPESFNAEVLAFLNE
jgi:pimeloyl-ACP methyl ester carboxylesterase